MTQRSCQIAWSDCKGYKTLASCSNHEAETFRYQVHWRFFESRVCKYEENVIWRFCWILNFFINKVAVVWTKRRNHKPSQALQLKVYVEIFCLLLHVLPINWTTLLVRFWVNCFIFLAPLGQYDLITREIRYGSSSVQFEHIHWHPPFRRRLAKFMVIGRHFTSTLLVLTPHLC